MVECDHWRMLVPAGEGWGGMTETILSQIRIIKIINVSNTYQKSIVCPMIEHDLEVVTQCHGPSKNWDVIVGFYAVSKLLVGWINKQYMTHASNNIPSVWCLTAARSNILSPLLQYAPASQGHEWLSLVSWMLLHYSWHILSVPFLKTLTFRVRPWQTYQYIGSCANNICSQVRW